MKPRMGTMPLHRPPTDSRTGADQAQTNCPGPQPHQQSLAYDQQRGPASAWPAEPQPQLRNEAHCSCSKSIRQSVVSQSGPRRRAPGSPGRQHESGGAPPYPRLPAGHADSPIRSTAPLPVRRTQPPAERLQRGRPATRDTIPVPDEAGVKRVAATRRERCRPPGHAPGARGVRWLLRSRPDRKYHQTLLRPRNIDENLCVLIYENLCVLIC